MKTIQFKKLSVEETNELYFARTRNSVYKELLEIANTLLLGESIQINIPGDAQPENFRCSVQGALRRNKEYKYTTKVYGGTLIVKRIG